MSAATPADDRMRWLDQQLAQAASRALVNNLAATLKHMLADWRSDRPVDVAELRYEFKTGIEEIRAAYRTNMELVVLAMQEEMRATRATGRAGVSRTITGRPSGLRLGPRTANPAFEECALTWCAELPKKMPPTAPNLGSWLDRRLDRSTVGLGGSAVDRPSVSVSHARARCERFG